MSHRYSAGRPTAGAATPAGGVYAEMLAGATKSISVRSVIVGTRSNIGGSIALVRSAAIGTGVGSGIATGVAHRVHSPTTEARMQVAWSSNPTGYVSHLREVVLPVATGQAVELWSEDDGPLVIEPSSSLLIINQASGINAAEAGLNINFTWEEGPASDS